MEKQRKRRASRTNRITLDDVARHVGVSAITVSRALRSPQKVAPALRDQILEAAQTLGYVPNHAASALASARSMNIAVLIPSLTNMLFVDMIGGIEDILNPHGYQILIGTTRYAPEEEERLLRAYLGFTPDGLLITGLDHSAGTWELLRGYNRPIVHLMDMGKDTDSYTVGFSQHEAGATLTRHLLGKGYRRIGFVAVQLDPRTLNRGEGYRQALREAGFYDPRREIRVPTPSSIGLGAALLDQMLAQAPDCDAIFFCNDDLAHGALFQCRERGVRVPEDLAIVGFNDLSGSAWTVPPLTTIATPRREVGEEAARILLALLSGNPPQQRHLDLGYRLITRKSA